MSQYAPPEGFNWDEDSGRYVNIQILSDESGARYRRIVSFDANLGTYEQQIHPINTSGKIASVGLSHRRVTKSRRKQKPVWLVTSIIVLSVILVGVGIYLGYRKLKIDTLGYGMMMNDEEVVELLNMDSFEEHVESFTPYGGDFREEGIVK